MFTLIVKNFLVFQMMQFYCSLGSMPSVIPSLLSKPFDFWNYSPDTIEVTCALTIEGSRVEKDSF